MTNLAMWAAIVGFLLPPVLAIIQQSKWPDALRSVVAFLACLVAAAGTVAIQQDDWDWNQWVKASLLTMVTAMATYRNFWKPTGVAPTIETKTNLGG